MRVSVTITDEMNKIFIEMAKAKGVSKDKVIGEILKEHLNPTPKTNNERGAGRKEIFGSGEKALITEYRKMGMSYREIAKKLNCSIGLVHKIINEH